MGQKNRLLSAIADLAPAHFALVMATGIVSIASHLLGFWFVAMPLLWLNVAFYVILWALTVARIFLYPQRFLTDLNDHIRGMGFFTMVAGTCVLGSQFVVLLQDYRWAAALLCIGVTLWGFLIYAVFTIFIIKAIKPPLENGINGVWLVAVVATQSVSTLSSRVSPYITAHHDLILFFSFSMFLLGGMLYLLIIMLIFYRVMFFTLKPESLTPPYWINMGAVAISTLAGATLALLSPTSQFLKQVQPFTIGLTLFFWAFATWWIPLLLLLGAWRYLIRRVKISYDHQYWSVVFPLGMYTACTAQLAKAVNMDFLLEIPRYSIYVAILAWGLTFLGLLKALARYFLSATDASGK